MRVVHLFVMYPLFLHIDPHYLLFNWCSGSRRVRRYNSGAMPADGAGDGAGVVPQRNRTAGLPEPAYRRADGTGVYYFSL